MTIAIALTGPGILVEGEIEETPGGIAVAAAMPLEGSIEMWGGEVSLRTEIRLPADESADYEREVGDVGYCPSTGSFIVYAGPTPLSQEGRPIARYLVNRVGRLTNGVEQLWRLRPGTQIRIAWA